jgi:hypothetical protein
LVLSGEHLHRLLSALAPLLTAGNALLGLLERLLRLPGIGYHVAIRRDEEHLHPHVDARLFAREGQRPVSRPVRGNGWVGTSAQEKQTYQPSASLLIVTVLIVPCTGRDQRTAMHPILDKTSEPLSRRAPLPSSLKVKECQRSRPWKRGNPGFSPACTRRKNA